MTKKDLRRLCDVLFVAFVGVFIAYHAATPPQKADKTDKAQAVTVPERMHAEAITPVRLGGIEEGEPFTLSVVDASTGVTLTVLHGYSGQEINEMFGYDQSFFPQVDIERGHILVNKLAIAETYGLTGAHAVPMRVQIGAKVIAELPIVRNFEFDN